MIQIGRREKLSRTDKLNAEKMKEKNNKKKNLLLLHFLSSLLSFHPKKKQKTQLIPRKEANSEKNLL